MTYQIFVTFIEVAAIYLFLLAEREAFRERRVKGWKLFFAFVYGLILEELVKLHRARFTLNEMIPKTISSSACLNPLLLRFPFLFARLYHSNDPFFLQFQEVKACVHWPKSFYV